MIVFAKTRHHYDSYTDFWRLVELSGFPSCYVDEIDRSQPNCYIFTPWNGEVAPHLENERAKGGPGTVIWWCLERFDAMPRPLADIVAEADPLVDQIWVSDRWIATMSERLKYARFGSHPDLGSSPVHPPEYHFTHQSYAWGRREAMYKRLRKLGLAEGPSSWGRHRDAVLRRSRLMLNLQQYPDPVNAPIRFAVAAAYHLPIVSESINDLDLLEGLVSCAPYEDIPDAVRGALASPDASGEKIHDVLCREWTFRRCVEASV